MNEAGRFEIRIADTRERYEGLRTLWCEVFNDEQGFVDSMYECFGAHPEEGDYTSENIRGYVIPDENGDVISALTCFRCGEFGGIPAYTSYAICTHPSYRGKGLAGMLVAHVRDIVLEAGGVSIISPAEESLENFYGGHGYETFFYAKRATAVPDTDEEFEFDAEDAEYEKLEPELDMRPLGAAAYGSRREEFLSCRPHVKLADRMMNLIYNESLLSDGTGGLFLINRGDAVCVLGEQSTDNIEITELLVNPKLLELSTEITEEIACRIARHFGKGSVSYHTPGPGRCQSMIAGLTKSGSAGTAAEAEAYYGFPID